MGGIWTGFIMKQNGGPVVWAPYDYLQREKLPRAFAEERGLGLVLPTQLVGEWGLRMADRVALAPETGTTVQVLSVNGGVNPLASRSRPVYSDLVSTPGSRPRYPISEWPLFDHTEDLGVRSLSLIAPIGPGSQAFLVGPFGSGKTRSSRATVAALLSIAEKRRDMAFVVLQVGERRVDVQPMEDILGQYRGSFPICQFVSVLGETGPLATVNLCEVALETVKRLYELSYHVVYVVDSLAGLATEGYNPTTPPGSPLTKGGISEYAIFQIKRHVSVAGFGGDRSVTGIYTALVGEDATRGGSIFGEAGGPQSSTIWGFGNFLGTEYPKIDINRSSSREPTTMLPGDRYAIYCRVRRLVVNGGRPTESLELLKSLAGTPGGWDKASTTWKARWAAEDRGVNTARATKAAETLTAKGAEYLSLIAGIDKAVVAIFQMLTEGWQVSLPEALERLIVRLNSDQRAQLFALIEKAELMPAAKAPELSPDQAFLAAAETLRNAKVGDKAVVIRKALAAIGLTLEDLVAAKSEDPVGAMMVVSEKLKTETGTSFGRKTAESLVTEGFTPDEVYARLKAGTSPKNLLGEKARAKKK